MVSYVTNGEAKGALDSHNELLQHPGRLGGRQATRTEKLGKSPASKVNRSSRAYRGIFLLLLIGLLIAVPTGIGVGVHFRRKQSSSSSPPAPGSPSDIPPSTAPSNNITSSLWKPQNGTTWQIVLLNPPKLETSASESAGFQVWDIDLFDNPSSIMSQILSLDSKTICYFSAGTYENWRPDASQFQPADLGSSLSDWPGERWLDTSSPNVRNIMLARLDLAMSKGCNGVDPDNVDGYNNDSGLNLTRGDAIAYVHFLAKAAHSRNLSIGLKNAGDIIPDVIEEMEWSVQEQCTQYEECDLYRPFIDQGKPVFHVEYPKGADSNTNTSITTSQKTAICTNEGAKGFSTIIKNIDLDQWIESC